MTGVMLKGGKFKSLTIEPGAEKRDVSGTYQLLTADDKVIATQAFGGYNDIKVAMSPATSKALDVFIAAYRSDLNAILGLGE